jgi:hypothetical protein
MSEYNQQVYNFASGQLGRRVGRGDCWDLPHQALTSAGAQSSDTTRAGADYRWGDPVALEDITPGDVLQFRHHVIVTTVVTRAMFRDGSYTETTETRRQTRGHHSAIVAAGGRTSIEVFEQNVRPRGRVVQRNTIVIRGSGPTESRSTRNMRNTRRQMESASVVETTTVTVSGLISAYRPRAPQP